MNPQDTIRAIFTDVRSRLPAEIVAVLNFPEAKPLDKQGFFRWVGRIYGKPTGKIWNASWGLYQIYLGSPPDHQERVGGVNFGFSPKNKSCGGGEHEAAVYEIAEKFCSTHRGFHHGRRGGTWFGFGIDYNRTAVPGFPAERAASDMAELITATFLSLDALRV